MSKAKKESNPPMTIIEMHISKLGLSAKDKVTGFSGVLTSLSFDLYGCVQYVVKPTVDVDGKDQEGRWLDVSRLNISKKRVMPVPNFEFGLIAEGMKGAADKPLP